MSATADVLPPSTHNQETVVIGEALSESLALDNLELLQRRDQLVAAEARMPAVTDDESARKVSDYIDLLNALIKTAKTAHGETKAPYLEAGRSVDEFFFRGITEPADLICRRSKQALQKYLADKAAAERRAREEAERKAREEAEQKRREAEAAAQKLRDEQDLQSAIEAEQAAKAAEVAAVQARQAAVAPTSDMAKVKGTVGRAKSLKTFWDFADINRDSLDLNKLRPYLPLDGLEKAVRAYIAAGGRTLDGVRIFENTRI